MPPQADRRPAAGLAVTRRAALVLAAAALAGCGFQPVYGPGGSGGKLQNRVLVSTPSERTTYLLVRRIEERLGRAADPVYTLSVNLQMRVEGLGIDTTGTTNRFNLIGVAGYALSETASGQAITSGTVNSFTGFFASGTTVETLASERDARERLMVILADQIVARLLSANVPG